MKTRVKKLCTVLFILSMVCGGISQTGESSVYFKNFVRHSEGEFCTHLPPEATFTVYLNNDRSKILLENAPRWETGGDPNITGMGVFGAELGNFRDPALSVGDTVCFRFTCNATGQQGVLSGVVTAIPWPYFPATLFLQPNSYIPLPPQNISLSFNAFHQRVINWTPQPGAIYSVYRCSMIDTVFNGQPRRMYTRIAAGIQSGSYIDTTLSVQPHGYVVIPQKAGVYGSHSAEVADFPASPGGVEAAVAYANPLKVAITWQQRGDTTGLRYRIFRSQSPGVPVDSLHLVGESTHLYWLDASVVLGATYYYRVVAVNAAGIRSLPSPEISLLVEIFANGLPDLDVLYISRSPKYDRYEIAYDPPGYNPHPKPGTENVKHYPDPGELMTYTAVVRNSGGGTVEGFNLFWYVDSQLVQAETYGVLFPRQRIFAHYQRPWNTQPEKIRCTVQPIQTVNEITLQNNTVGIRSNALSFHFYAERNILDLFESHQNPMGSYSFEDWAQVHVKQMKQFFAQAVYPGVTPAGIPEAVFLDTVSYFPNGSLPSGGTHAPNSVLWDGQWGFTGDPAAINYFQNIVLGQQNGMDWALLHELGHQIGLIDLYNMDVQQSELQVIEPRTGQKPPLTPIAWDVLYYCSRSNYIMHSNFQNGYSDHSAGALKRNSGKRRGYFGEYLADLPFDNSLLLKYPDGSPVTFAEVWVYQAQDNAIPNLPKFRGQSDSLGVYRFPHFTDPLYQGGIYVENPFSTAYSMSPHVVGTNSVLFFRVAKGDSIGYAFMDICDFNVAYWSGDTASADYSLTITDWYLMPQTGVETNEQPVPKRFALSQNYPNPFNPTTVIRYRLPVQSQVTLNVYNLLGQSVRILINSRQPAGEYSVKWDGLNEQGVPVPSGIYLYRLVANDFNRIRKMLLVR